MYNINLKLGALTLKSTSFKFRSWELDTQVFRDIITVEHSKINIDYIGNKVMRVLPNLLEKTNWLVNKTRFFL